MSRWRMTSIVNVDDELLAEHDGQAKPPPNDVHEWYGGDLARALEDGLAELEHDEIEEIEEIGQ